MRLQMCAPPDKISNLFHSMQPSMSDIKAFAAADMLRPNDNETYFMLITSERAKHLHSLPTSITNSNAYIPFKQTVI